MLNWAITFFILAIISAVLGFGGIAGTLVWAAELLFYAFLVLFVVTLIANVVSGRKTHLNL